MATKAGMADGYCRIRKEILDKALAVSIGDKYQSPHYDLQYRWLNDDTNFQVFYLGEWQDANSIDFDFN